MALSDKELSAADLTATQSNWIQYSKQHCNNLPPGSVTGFEWKDYSPKAFRFFICFQSSLIIEFLLHTSIFTISINCVDILRCGCSSRLIQELENIDNDDYKMLVCSDETIRKVSSTLRPGNMFLFSKDSRFAIKTLRKSEVKVTKSSFVTIY